MAHGSGRFRARPDAPAKIRASREAQGLTQVQLGRLLLYPTDAAGQRAVTRVELGEAGLEGVMNAAAALGLKLEEVIEWASDRIA